MRRSERRSRVPLVGVLVAVLVAACGGTAATPSPAASQPAPASNPPATSAEPSAAPSADTEAARAALVEAAKAEGALTWYSTEAVPVNDAAIAAFQEKYGIPVTVLRAASTELLARYSAEREAGQATADVFTYGSPEPFSQHPEWFVKLSPDLVPELATYPTGHGGWSEQNVLLNVTPNVIAYNTTAVTDAPTTWESPLDPKYKGKIILTDPNGGRTYMGWAYAMRERYGEEYLTGLAAQELTVSPTGGPGAQQVAAGAFDLSIPNATSLVAPLKAEGAPIEFVIPVDPALGSDLRANVTSNATHPNAAALFLDFRTSLEGQEVVCKAVNNAVASPRSDSTSCIKLDPTFQFIDYSVLTPEVGDELSTLLGLK